MKVRSELGYWMDGLMLNIYIVIHFTAVLPCPTSNDAFELKYYTEHAAASRRLCSKNMKSSIESTCQTKV